MRRLAPLILDDFNPGESQQKLQGANFYYTISIVNGNIALLLLASRLWRKAKVKRDLVDGLLVLSRVEQRKSAQYAHDTVPLRVRQPHRLGRLALVSCFLPGLATVCLMCHTLSPGRYLADEQLPQRFIQIV